MPMLLDLAIGSPKLAASRVTDITLGPPRPVRSCRPLLTPPRQTQARRASQFAPWKNVPPRRADNLDGGWDKAGRQPASVGRRDTSVHLATNQQRRRSERSGSIFRHRESRRSRSARLARPPRPRMQRRHVPRGDRCACGGESWGRRGSSDPADLERRVQDAAKRPVAVTCGGGAASPPPVERFGGPTDAGCRADRPSRRRQRQHSPRRDVCPVANGVPAARVWRGGV